MANVAICKQCPRYTGSFITEGKKTLAICRVLRAQRNGFSFFTSGDVAVLGETLIPEDCIYQLEQTLSIQ